MKKLMFAVAALAAGVACAEITSANVVGYQSFDLDLDAGQYCVAIAPQFSSIKSETGSWMFTENIFDAMAIGGDQMSNFNTDAWDIEYWQFQGFEGESSLGWLYSYNDAWTGDPVENTVSGFEVSKGDVLFFQPGDAISGAVVAGQVQDIAKAAVVSFPDANYYNIVNPYPVDTTLADLESFMKPGDQVSVFDADGWDIVYYQYLGVSEGFLYSYNDPWTGDSVDSFITDRTTIALPAGKGGYFQASDDEGRTWTVSIK